MDINSLPEGYLKHALNAYVAAGNSLSGKSVKESTLYFAINLNGKSGTIKLLSNNGSQDAVIGITNIPDKNKLDSNKDVILTAVRIKGDIVAATPQASVWAGVLPPLVANAEFYVTQKDELFRDVVSVLHNTYVANAGSNNDDFRAIPSVPVIRGGEPFDMVIDTPPALPALAADVNVLVQFRCVEVVS